MEELQARTWLSEPRYTRFLDAADGDHDQAVALYEWHADLSVASFGLIHRFEVLLRNSIDGVLGEGQPQMPIKDTWASGLRGPPTGRDQAGDRRHRAP